jgi:glycyl-tRNA synthetase beta chain
VRDLLFELGTEELPSGSVFPLAESLANHLKANLAKACVSHDVVQFFATPRRLAVLIRNVQESALSQTLSRRGPAFNAGLGADGKPTPALIGFARSCGVTVDELTVIETDKGKWWNFEKVAEGVKTTELLPSLLSESLAALPISKPMRWGDGDAEFVRPVHWAVLLFGEDVIPCSLMGVQTGRQSHGHRFHHPEAFDVVSPLYYEAALKDAFVIADFGKRRQLIVDQIKSLTQSAGFIEVMPSALLDEVTSIVEWPVALMAKFEETFLEVPAEALVASMQSHQKCFALRSLKGDLVPYFITVSNIKSQHPLQVIAGNEKVMRARLSDAAFFYHQDRRKPLIDYREATAQVVFQEKLGTLFDKSERLKLVLNQLVEPLHLDAYQASRAAELSKCDLMTGMVGEFPELQGLMGSYYARYSHEENAVEVALYEQYLPQSSADKLPESALGGALSLVDRLDTLVGAFALGQKPSGVKDPFKLRRHALAVARLLAHMEKAPPVSQLIQCALASYGEKLKLEAGSMEALHAFILERMYAFYEAQGITADFVHAVRCQQEDCLFDLDQRIRALQTFAKRQEAVSLSAACKRVNNLLHHASAGIDNECIDTVLLQEPAEIDLYKRLQSTSLAVDSYYVKRAYQDILSQLASLREPVDAFFEHVMVMVDNDMLKRNRLNLLRSLQKLLQGVADISLLELSRV